MICHAHRNRGHHLDVVDGVGRRLRLACSAGRTGSGESPSDTAGVTILKPLNGADAELDENLASFFQQDHPNVEIVFGA